MLNLQPRKFASRAESLIETLVAITVIVVATTSAMILVRTALVGNEVIGEKIVALNLGLEAVEAVKNIRDTNYLTLASDPDNCWNTLGITDVADCETGDVIANDETYYLVRDFDTADGGNAFEWNMEVATDTVTDGFLSLYEYTPTYGPMAGETVQIYALDGGSVETAGFTKVEGHENAFQRLLYIEDVGTDSFNVTVTVNWMVKDQAKSLSLTRTIANVY